jgi:hypothetical protein
MDCELGIYSKMGGGEKYRNVALMNGGSNASKKDQRQGRIERLEKKIETLQKVLDKLKEEEK